MSDAKRFYEILDNPNFIYFTFRPRSIEAEKEYVRSRKEKRENNISHDYTITYGGRAIGGCGIKVNQHRNDEGELGVFLDEACWGKGIATRAMRMMERIAFNDLKLRRLVIIHDVGNRASKRIAEKCGYKREGRLRKVRKNSKGEWIDSYQYSKIRGEK